jgi:hypothetical protein
VKADEELCKSFNADIMRSLVARKMQKNKTFYELKLQPQSFLSPLASGMGLSPNANLNAHFSYQQQVSRSPRINIHNAKQQALLRQSQQITSHNRQLSGNA